MYAESAQQATDVIPHRLHAQVQLARDLLGRAALFEHAQDLALTRRQARMRRQRRLLLNILELTEDPDGVATTLDRDGAQFYRHALAFGRKKNGAVVRALRRPEQVAHEDLAPAPPL